MSSNISPSRFDNGDFECWLREFDACCDANGWKVVEYRDDKILKLPAFLRGKAASHFYAIPVAKRAIIIKMLWQNLKNRCVPPHSASNSTPNSKIVLFVVAKSRY